jgi:hypothetical protein
MFSTRNKRQEKIHAKYLTSMNKKLVSADEERREEEGINVSDFDRKDGLYEK